MARNNLQRIQQFHATKPGAYDKIRLTFNDGSAATCHNMAANLIVQLYDKVNDENKVRVAEKLNESKFRYAQLVDFALKHSTFKLS